MPYGEQSPITDDRSNGLQASRRGSIGLPIRAERQRRSDDAAVRARLRELANERRRFGYRRLAILLQREGRAINLKRVYRLYREEQLMERKRR